MQGVEKKALFGKSPFELRWQEVPPPRLEPNRVLVRVKAGGICGTDLHFLRHNTDWTPLGHEAVGVVEEIGEGVEGVQVGEPVIVENHAACRVCRQCKNGRPQHCENITTYMSDQAGFSDYLVVRFDMVHKYDEEKLDYVSACLAEPLTVALDVTLRAGISFNDEVAVFGPGPIGLMVVRLARLHGARRVFLVGSNSSTPRGSHRLEVGRRMGADVTLSYEEGNVVEEVLVLAPLGVDRVIVTAPPYTLVDAMKMTRFGGIIAFNGIEFGEGGRVTFDANEFHFKKLELRASHAIPNHYFPIALDLLNRGVIGPKLILSHVFGWEGAEKAFQTLLDPQERAVKVVITL
ncbi:MAG: zinc-dependent alcohol dehydrogenase [Candidatus Caldatribacteriaceae bacterium]